MITDAACESSDKTIPRKYKILDFLLELRTNFWAPEVLILILSPTSRNVAVWCQEFEQGIFSAIENENFLTK